MTAAKRRRRSRGVTPAGVRKLAMALPGATEGTSYGTPAWKVRGKLFARLHQDGESLVLRVDFDQRDLLMQANPKAYFITDHYTNYEMMQVRLSAVDEGALSELLLESWKRGASKKMIEALEAEG
ncbi:MAG: MmcQ/YjbR family DNA-binding protein [Myxococcota bacterium]